MMMSPENGINLNQAVHSRRIYTMDSKKKKRENSQYDKVQHQNQVRCCCCRFIARSLLSVSNDVTL